MNLHIFSFFSGVGFLDLGFEKSGYNVVFVNEYSKAFLDGYKFARENMGIKSPKYGYYCGDINDLLTGKKRKFLFDCIQKSREDALVGFIGGPPCPDFSIAGKNEGITGENGMLTNSYKKLILRFEPDFFVFENVKGLWSTKKHRAEYDKIKASFRRKGYVLTDRLVNAIEYGVPQDRERVILFGIKYNLLCNSKKDAGLLLNNKFSWEHEKKYYLNDIINCNWPEQDGFVEDGIIEKPRNIIAQLSVEYWFKKNDVCSHFNSDDYFEPHSTERFCTINEGDVSRKSFKRLHRWRYSPTAAYGNNEVHLHPYKVRRLSVAETLAIQSLPKNFILPKTLTKSDMFKTVGNGVPFLLAKGIAKSIKEFIFSEVITEER